MSQVEAAIRAAFGATQALRGVSVSYFDGTDTYMVIAVRGEQLSEDIDNNGMVVQTRQRDYLISAEDFDAAGMSAPPKLTDKLTDLDETWEVIADDREEAWRWHHRFKEVYRIHTKQVS